jgi:hypothetical protein
MPVRFAVTSSAWSSGSTWDNGAVPIAGDDVYANGNLVTINQNINVLRISSLASPVRIPDIATPAMTSDTTPAGTGIVFSGGAGGNAPAWRAFDQTDSLFWQSNVANTGIIGYQFTIGKIIKQYAFQAWSTNTFNPSTWTFQGSNDGSSYTTIETVTAFATTINTWYVRNISSNTTSYTYYRMNITAVQTAGNNPVIRELQMTESTGSVYGTIGSGSFISTDGISITASNPLYGVTAGGVSSALLVTGSHTVYLSGSVRGGAANTIRGIQIVNNGNLYITGSVTGGTVATLSYGIFNNAGRLEVLGNVIGGADTTTHGIAVANGTTIINGNLIGTTNAGPIVMTAGTGTVTVNGNTIITTSVIGQSTGVYVNGGTGVLNFNGILQAASVPGIAMLTGATVNLTGSIYAAANVGINSTVASTINVSGSIYASNSAPGISSTSTAATVRISGPTVGYNNINPVYSPKIQLISNVPCSYELQSDTFPRDVIFYDTSFTSSLPTQTNVRSGSLYGGTNQFSGSMVVPSTGSVRYGVPVDNTTGSAILTPQDILDYVVSSLTGSNSIGSRLQNIATVQTTAATIAAFKGK